MILADKIIEERKKLGLSQEELAEKLNVSRQAVSKWESAQSIPDLQKIVAMSALFSVSTDYLLKDEMEAEQTVSEDSEPAKNLRRISMEEANDYMNVMKNESKNVALGVLLCILCPVLLIFLTGLADENIAGMNETAAVAIGLPALFLLVAGAVFLFIRYASRIERYEYLEKEGFETAYGISGLVKEKKADFEPTYVKYLAIGIILCILSPLPLIVAALLNGSDALLVSLTALLLCIVAGGVYLIVRVSLVKNSFAILLKEGDYRERNKKKSRTVGTVMDIYWSLVTAGYLTWSFLSGKWSISWIVWPIAGVLSAPVSLIAKSICGENGKEE